MQAQGLGFGRLMLLGSEACCAFSDWGAGWHSLSSQKVRRHVHVYFLKQQACAELACPTGRPGRPKAVVGSQITLMPQHMIVILTYGCRS